MANQKSYLQSGTLYINGMTFYAYHGCLPEETKVGNRFEVNIELRGDFSSAVQRDELKNTFDYAIVYDVVKREMSVPSKLIEHVAGRIANTLKNELNEINELSVTVIKFNPPVNGIVADTRIKLEYYFN